MSTIASAENLHLALTFRPYLYSTKGNGARARAKNAGTLDAQCRPRLTYIWPVKRGKAAARTERKMAVPASTEAEKIA